MPNHDVVINNIPVWCVVSLPLLLMYHITVIYVFIIIVQSKYWCKILFSFFTDSIALFVFLPISRGPLQLEIFSNGVVHLLLKSHNFTWPRPALPPPPLNPLYCAKCNKSTQSASLGHLKHPNGVYRVPPLQCTHRGLLSTL